jgi:hypothetical protein
VLVGNFHLITPIQNYVKKKLRMTREQCTFRTTREAMHQMRGREDGFGFPRHLETVGAPRLAQFETWENGTSPKAERPHPAADDQDFP